MQLYPSAKYIHWPSKYKYIHVYPLTKYIQEYPLAKYWETIGALVAGAWTERKKIFHGGSFLKLADDNMDIQNPEAQNRELGGF